MAEKKVLDAPEDQGKKGKSTFKWIILVVLILLLAGAGGAAYWFLMGPGSAPPETAGEDGSLENALGRQDRMTAEIITLSPFIVNLADPLGRRFLRMTLDVEVVSREAASDMKRFESRVRDAIILLLSSKSFGDLASMESKIKLKNEIVERLNQILGSARVSNVYFTEFVIQ